MTIGSCHVQALALALGLLGLPGAGVAADGSKGGKRAAALQIASEYASEHWRVAVVVGANARTSGRQELLYAYRDADGVAQVLREVGGFRSQDVHVLHDPDPDRLLQTLDRQLERLRQAGPAGLLLFYYSGHADERALYPAGKPLALAELRERLEDERVQVRIGLIDACSGGGWTGTKGNRPAVSSGKAVRLSLESEGSVLIASSSGTEAAHESERLRGSFFTHHWNGGLRGAADRDGDGRVTVSEAFDYAKEQTVRDSALHAGVPQHPSYQLNLRGRAELTLSQVGRGDAALVLEQTDGAVQLVQVETGTVLLQTPPGARTLHLAVPPGDYIARRSKGKQVWARELAIDTGEEVHLRDQELEPVDAASLGAKRADSPALAFSTLPDGMAAVRMLLGVRHGLPLDVGIALSGGRSLVVGLFGYKALTSRLEWLIPTLAFTYRFGEHGSPEWLVFGGLINWGIEAEEGESLAVKGDLGAGVGFRYPLSSSSSLDLTAGTASTVRRTGGPEPSWEGLRLWNVGGGVAYSLTLQEVVTISAGATIAHGNLDGRADRCTAVALGSGLPRGLRQLPLVQIHLGQAVALDAYASIAYSLDDGSVTETYQLGATIAW